MEDNIHEVATETVSHIRRQERQLVAALYAMCGDDIDDERKKALSEHMRRLEDACDAADKLLYAASEGGGPAAFLLQRRSTVDAMTSLMTSQTTSITDWPKYERQVRFEAYGVESARGLRIGQLVVDDEDSDVEGDSWQRDCDDVSSAQQHIGTYWPVSEPTTGRGTGRWVEVKLSDMGVQTDESYVSVSVSSSRCEASGGATRLSISHDHHATTGQSAHRPTATPRDHVTSLYDVITATTVTDRAQTRHQWTQTDVMSHHQQTNTEPLPRVDHRATSTDQLQTCSRHVTATPYTTDQSTSTHSSSDASHDHDDTDSDLTHMSWFSTCSCNNVDASQSQQTPHSCSPRVDDSFALVASPVASLQPTSASTFNVPHLSSWEGSSELTAGIAPFTSALTTGDCNESPSVRLTALLPEIARTADLLAASHFSSDHIARLLRDIVYVGQEMTSSCSSHSREAATDTTDQQISDDLNAAELSCNVKSTQTMTVRSDAVDEGVGQSVVTTSDASTLTDLRPMTFDKETSTTRTHQVNKNVATDSLSSCDKQTWMPIDVSTAYLASAAAARRRVLSVSRGTSTPASFTAPSQPLVDHATSPVRVVLVDKSVMASKAEALQPIDTFQAAGQLSGPLSPRTRRPLSLSPLSKLACITETAERYDDEEHTEELDDASATIHRPELLDTSQMRSPQWALSPTQLSITGIFRSQQQPQVCQLSRNVFNFDHVVTSRYAVSSTECQCPTSLDDNLVPSSSTSDIADLSASVAETSLSAVAQRSIDDAALTESQPPVNN